MGHEGGKGERGAIKMHSDARSLSYFSLERKTTAFRVLE